MKKVLGNFLKGETIEDVEAESVITEIRNASVEDMIRIISDSDFTGKAITTKNIPQFSDFHAVDDVVAIVKEANEQELPIFYQYVGDKIKKSITPGAQTKYGENHLKLAIEMGLVTEKPYKLTNIGQLFDKLSTYDKNQIRTKLFMRVPIVQNIFVESIKGKYEVENELSKYLSSQTVIRRRTNIRRMVLEISQISSEEIKKQINDNVQWY